mgnify:CR=1 FL=1
MSDPTRGVAPALTVLVADATGRSPLPDRAEFPEPAGLGSDPLAEPPLGGWAETVAVDVEEESTVAEGGATA